MALLGLSSLERLNEKGQLLLGGMGGSRSLCVLEFRVFSG